MLQIKSVIIPDWSFRPLKSKGTVTRHLKTDACQGDKDHEVIYLEHVEIHIKMEYTYRGDVNMFLISPHGMRSEILRVRPSDDNKEGIHFTFMTVFNWGEKADGVWTLEIHDKPPKGSKRVNSGKLLSWSLTLYGTRERPEQHLVSNMGARAPDGDKMAHSMNKVELKHMIASEMEVAENVHIRSGHEKKSGDEQGDYKHEGREQRDQDKEMRELVELLEDMLKEDWFCFGVIKK